MTENPNAARNGLPPEEVRRWDVRRDGRLPTPLDQLGRVELNGLICFGKATVAEDYTWESDFNNMHHLQWPGGLYQPDTPYELLYNFRELMQRKVIVPCVFHNWLHAITEIPPKPPKDVMRESAVAEKVALELTRIARHALAVAQRTDMTIARQQTRLDRVLDQYSHYVDLAAQVPHEFQLVTREQTEVQTVDEMVEKSVFLGRLALDAIPNRVLAVRSI